MCGMTASWSKWNPGHERHSRVVCDAAIGLTDPLPAGRGWREWQLDVHLDGDGDFVLDGRRERPLFDRLHRFGVQAFTGVDAIWPGQVGRRRTTERIAVGFTGRTDATKTR